jgi:hypothetical protein
VYDAASPLQSFVALAPDAETGDNGRLTLHEVYNLDLSQAGLVALPALERGQAGLGEEILPASRAFIYAGAPSVLARLWQVEDRAAPPEVVKAFYTHLQAGYTKAVSLRLAQLELLDRPVYLWAGFVLVGDMGTGLPFPTGRTARSAPALVSSPPITWWIGWSLLGLAFAGSSSLLWFRLQRQRTRQARRASLRAARQRLLAQPPSLARSRGLSYVERELRRFD